MLHGPATIRSVQVVSSRGSRGTVAPGCRKEPALSELIDIDIPYALEMRVVTEAQIPVLGHREIVTRSYSSVEFSRDEAGGWTQTFIACAIEGDGGQVEFPASFVRSIDAKTSKVHWTDGHYSADTGAAFIGVRKPVPKLPTAIDDPLVFDADRDGYPGVTVNLTLPVFGNVRLYLVQANHSKLAGTVVNGEIRGQAELVRLETRTLGASINLFAVNPPVSIIEGKSTFRIVPDPERKCRQVFP